MNVAISAVRTKGTRINRHELVSSIQELGHNVKYIGQASKEALHDDYIKYNVDFIEIPLARVNTNPFKELHSLNETRKAIKNNDIDCLIAYGIRTFPTMVIAARLAGVKNILCIVNGSGRLFQLTGLKGIIVKLFSYPMLWLSFLLSSNILFQNPDDKKMIKKKGLLWRRNYGKINGSGVNIDEFQSNSLEEKPVFAMVSRLTGSKGVNEYVKSASYVKSIYPEVVFYLVGPMDDEDATIDKKLFKEATTNGVIDYIGMVEDVKPYIEKSMAFILPSYYPEGIPRSILEAMAMGRPIITTDVPGCRETVIDKRNGFKIPPKNSKLLAEKIIWMIENKESVRQMGEYSRKITKEKFNVHKINSIMLKSIGLQ